MHDLHIQVPLNLHGSAGGKEIAENHGRSPPSAVNDSLYTGASASFLTACFFTYPLPRSSICQPFRWAASIASRKLMPIKFGSAAPIPVAPLLSADVSALLTAIE